MSTNEAAERLSSADALRKHIQMGPEARASEYWQENSLGLLDAVLAAAKAEGAREAVERIRAGMKARSVARGNVYWAVMGLLDEEAAR
jgi:hypothetical protein